MADLTFEQVANIINTQYPDALPILQKPGVFQVYWDFIQSKQGANPWPDTQLQASLRATPYYQQTDQSERQWDILAATDPATAQQKYNQVVAWTRDASTSLGIPQLDSGAVQNFLDMAVKQGWTQDQIRYNLIASTAWGSGLYPQGGEIGNASAQVKALARSYAVPLSDQSVVTWGRQLAEGAITQDTIKGYLVEQAKSLFPGLGAALDSGQTVEQYADPYKQIAVQQLGINPGDIDWSDPKWGKALNQIDPKTGARVSQSLDQWMSTIRTDPTYGYDQTSGAKQSASQLASQLQQRFGAAA